MQITSEVDVRESIRETGNFRAVCADNYCSMKCKLNDVADSIDALSGYLDLALNNSAHITWLLIQEF